MRLSSHIAKLERQAKILRCDWCKYSLRDMLPDEEKRAKTSPYCENIPCRYCGTEITYNLTGYSRRQLEVFRLTTCAPPGEMYRDERVYAATLLSYFEKYRKTWAHIASMPPEELEKEIEARRQRAKAKDETKLSKDQLRYSVLKKRAFEFIKRVGEEEEARYGPAKHKLAGELESLKSILPENVNVPYYSPIKLPEKAARKALYFASLVAKLEVALWGTPRTSVSTALQKFSKMVQAFNDERAALVREKEVEEARRKAEREAEEERRRAAREAVRAESLNRW